MIDPSVNQVRVLVVDDSAFMRTSLHREASTSAARG
jgi:hypothetical protein